MYKGGWSFHWACQERMIVILNLTNYQWRSHVGARGAIAPSPSQLASIATLDPILIIPWYKAVLLF